MAIGKGTTQNKKRQNPWKSEKCAAVFLKGILYLLLQVLLQRIVWPEDEDDDCPLQTKCRITGYMRHFILNGRFAILQEGNANMS